MADRMREMSFEVWFKMLEHVFKSLLSYMRHIQVGGLEGICFVIMLIFQKMLSIIVQVCQEVGGVLTPLTPLKTPTLSKFGPPLSNALEDKEEEAIFDEKMEEVEEVETVSFAEQETSDRLDQLLMEEELSDEHIMVLAMSAKQDGVEEGEKNGTAESTENHLDKKRCVREREREST